MSQIDARALRGGSWNNNTDNLRCAARNNNHPDNNWNNNGFRVVRAQSCPILTIDPVLDPDAGTSRSAGLVFGHDIWLIFRQRSPLLGGVSSNIQTGRLLE
ncbi:MAG: SUMF1/EgtB/PvdO family nonheme iron enzyme [bacterium]